MHRVIPFIVGLVNLPAMVAEMIAFVCTFHWSTGGKDQQGGWVGEGDDKKRWTEITIIIRVISIITSIFSIAIFIIVITIIIVIIVIM